METSFLPATKTKHNLIAFAVIGVVGLALGIPFAPDRVWCNLFVAMFFLLTIGLAGAVFLALTYVSGAAWHVAFRRVPEALAGILPVAGVGMLLVLAARMDAYGWQHEGHGGVGTFWFKQYWLEPTFWLMRSIAYVVLWTVMAQKLCQGAKSDLARSSSYAGRVRWSAVFLAVYAITFSLATADWLMALEPLWFSTIWGVYHFAGMMQAGLAVIVLLGLWLRAPGRPLDGFFKDDHLHDLGKLLLGFSCFWMYIWFSQYMLIWYANIPEETSYFITRTGGAWAPIVVASLVFNWVIPFFVLLPRPAKRSAAVMTKVAVVVLIGRWVDLYVMVFPAVIGENPAFGVWEFAGICLLVGAGCLLVVRAIGRTRQVPQDDPFLRESLHHHAY